MMVDIDDLACEYREPDKERDGYRIEDQVGSWYDRDTIESYFENHAWARDSSAKHVWRHNDIGFMAIVNQTYTHVAIPELSGTPFQEFKHNMAGNGSPYPIDELVEWEYGDPNKVLLFD